MMLCTAVIMQAAVPAPVVATSGVTVASANFKSLADINADVMALSPWELLGEDDGLGDSFGQLTQLQTGLVDYAQRFLGVRYRHGAKGPSAFDCSGFTSYVFNNFGLSLSPSSRAQGVQGHAVDKSDVMVGDLMFFSGRRGGKIIGHVGMVIDVDQESGMIKFIHAATKTGVEIQSFPDNGYYSKRFLQFRRVIDADGPLALPEMAHDGTVDFEDDDIL